MKKRGLNLPKERKFVGPASFLKRVAAFLIDLFVIYFIIGYPLNSLLKKLIPPTDSFTDYFKYLVDPQFPPIAFVVIASLEIISLLYFVALEYRLGQSLGKMMMKIYIVSDKKELKIWQVVVRSLFLLVDIIWMIDVIYYVFNKEKRRLFEVLSKTRTVQKYVMT